LDQVGRLQLDFPEVSTCTVNEETFSRLSFDRKTERYQEAMLIARMLLLNYRPDITGGAENVIAILFDMNKLWEEWVYRRLKKEETVFDITVQRQQSSDFWQLSQSMTKTIRPDIVIKDTVTQQTTVVDTKWKLMYDFVPSDDDLKQMYVYNLFWNCYRSVLLYPSLEDQCVDGDYIDFRDQKKLLTSCRVQTASVLDQHGKLNNNFGESVLKMLLS
jgi:5-methylcytosine-specific restriction enzyme subunit McrC